MQNQKKHKKQKLPTMLYKAEQLVDPYRRHNGRMDHYLLKQEVEFVNKILRHEVQPGTLLNLFCGTGEVSPMLQITGFRTLDLDINRLALAAFHQHSQDVSLVQGDVLHLPFLDESLDVIVAIHGFDLVDRVGFLRECSRVLCDGGLLIFDALNRHSYKLVLKRLGHFLGSLLAVRPYDKWIDVFNFREVVQLISHTQFGLQAAHGYGWPPFPVRSNSRLVNATAFVELVFQLDRFPLVSPRIVIAARKKSKF